MATERIKTPEVFTTNPNLVSIDGPDGVGKGTFCEVLGSMLGEVLGREKVVVTSGTRFEASAASKRLGLAVKRVSNLVARNRLFLLSTRAIFQEIVIPSLGEGKVVVLDSSTIRHLAYTLAKHGKESTIFQDTQGLVESGRLDFHLFPEIRIILMASEESLLGNLQGRGFTDVGDPADLAQVRARIVAYRRAIDIIKGLHVEGQTTWIELENNPLPKDQVKEGLSMIIKERVLPKLNFLGS